jgi:6-phosphofructokinase 1
LGTNRFVPSGDAIAAIASQVEAHDIDGLLMVGGWTGYVSAYELASQASEYPALAIPIVCLPASINNDLPGSELSIGADTALNSIVRDVDKIKQSAVASGRCFVVEVMGYDCGYLALMSGLATGAERVYLPEEGISLQDLENDVNELREGFAHGKRLGLVIRSEHSDPVYTTGFIKALFGREGGGEFDVREAILGHVQQGGDPSPFDRIQATRLASKSVEFLIAQALADEPTSAFIGLQHGKVQFTPLLEFPSLIEDGADRPREQGWMALRPLAKVMAQPEPRHRR